MRGRPQHARRGPVPFGAILAALVLLTLGTVVWRVRAGDDGGEGSGVALHQPQDHPSVSASRRAATPSTPGEGLHPAASAGMRTNSQGVATPGPINTKFDGLTTFRGNATRDYYGEGPVPRRPRILWKAPPSAMCSRSESLGDTTLWCGTGWTGQPNVIQHPGGKVEVREGAFDGHYHFWNGDNGGVLRPDLVTGDLAKGSATSDSQGYPLYYAGSRDNYLRVVAMDRPNPTVLWKLNSDTSVPNPVWNNDWDGAPLQIGDYLLEGGENSWFYVIELNRGYDAQHRVTVDPRVVMRVPGWDRTELKAIGDTDVSIENSVSFSDGVAYFSNSGGLVQGWDISNVLAGGSGYRRVFRFWAGDDVDASIVIDPQGYLYVARHIEENVPRSVAQDHRVGSLMKLDPTQPNDPVVWSVPIGGYKPDGGILSTPALYDGVVYVMGAPGELDAVDQGTGKLMWSMPMPGPTWMSPVPVDGVLIAGDCKGALHGFDISNPGRKPRQLWTVQLSGCVESTPAVWHGMIYVGTRGGYFYGIGDRHA